MITDPQLVCSEDKLSYFIQDSDSEVVTQLHCKVTAGANVDRISNAFVLGNYYYRLPVPYILLDRRDYLLTICWVYKRMFGGTLRRIVNENRVTPHGV